MEHAVFEKGRLNKIRTAIESFGLGEIDKNTLGKKLLKVLVDTVEVLLKDLTFYFDHGLKKQSIDEFVENKDVEKLENDLKERDELLTLIGHRVKIISERLKSNNNS